MGQERLPRAVPLVVLVALFLLFAVVVNASDPPDSETNPVTGNIESVDAAWDGSDYDIRHTVDAGQGGPRAVVFLTTHADDDLAPRIAIKGNGDSWVVWWRDSATDGVFYRRHDLDQGTWSSEARVSEPDESSRHPEAAHDGSATWLAYEFDSGTDTGVAVTGIQDDPEPFGTRTLIATTSHTGDVDVLIRSEQGHVWVTWVDSAQDVGWSEYDKTTETWDTAAYESYANDSVEEARSRIRATVLGI